MVAADRFLQADWQQSKLDLKTGQSLPSVIARSPAISTRGDTQQGVGRRLLAEGFSHPPLRARCG